MSKLNDVFAALSKHLDEATMAKLKPELTDLFKKKGQAVLYSLTDKKPEGKMPQQMRVCYDALVELTGKKNKPVSFEDWCEAAGKSLQTKQAVDRIVAYYRPQLISAGAIRQVGEEARKAAE